MCLTRIYVRRRRDGRLMRFNSEALLREYRRAERETGRSLPVIDRDEFRLFRQQTYDEPKWIASTRYQGMSLMAECN